MWECDSIYHYDGMLKNMHASSYVIFYTVTELADALILNNNSWTISKKQSILYTDNKAKASSSENKIYFHLPTFRAWL